jgi:hypothetical protein
MHAEARFVVHNTSSRPCWVRRYPQIVFADARGRRLVVPRRERPATLSIQSGTSAVFGVVFLNQSAFTPPACPTAISTSAISATVSPRAHFELALKVAACPLPHRRPYVDPFGSRE